MRIGTLVVAVLVFGLAACQRDESPAPVPPQAQSCVLRVGWDPWEPYQFQGADGAVAGLDVELIRQLAADARCTVEFAQGSWQELLGRVRAGAVDVLMAATPTAERLGYARFSPPYRRETFALFTRTADAQALAGMDLQQLAQSGRRIAITDGYYYGERATQVIQGEATARAFISAPVVELNYTRLVDGEVDVLLDDPFVAAAVLRRKGMSAAVARHPLEIHSGEVSLMYSKAGVAEDLVRRLDAALAARKADGSLQRLLDKYQG